MTCAENEARNTGESGHCAHDVPGKGERVCCWCGDLFLPEADEHGEYAPADLQAREAEAARHVEALLDVVKTHLTGMAFQEVYDARAWLKSRGGGR